MLDQPTAAARLAPTRCEVRLLGPVRLVGPAGPVDLPDDVPVLLGLLALRPGRPVPATALAGPTRPVDRRIGDLTAAFARCGLPDAVRPVRDGYLLRLAGRRIDTVRFGHLLHRARSRAAAGDPGGAAGLFTAALRLWQPERPAGTPAAGWPAGGDADGAARPAADPGVRAVFEAEPMAGCPVDPAGWAAAEVGRLVQARVAAVEERWECGLRLAAAAYSVAGGPTADRDVVLAGQAAVRTAGVAVADLEAAVARHPLRARLWELLLAAAFLAAGRRAAGEVAARAGRTFADQLGVEPGERLRVLAEHARRGDLADRWPVTVPSPRPARAPERPARRPALPVPMTALLGRDDLLAAVLRALGTRRLVTLTGPGGAGKTRLAVAVAHRYAPAAWFVDLSAVDRPAGVAEAVATALGSRPDPVGAAPDTRADPAEAFGPAPAMLVLDNCEHLLPGCRDLVRRLLAGCPQLRILATSRVALRSPAETAVPVPPLASPTPGTGHTIAGLSAHPATRLFLERARGRAGRPVPEDSADDVARLCAELDGLPLAIELAAARTSLLSVAEIVRRTRADLRLLRSPDPTAPDRHRTLTAAVESSVAQLDGPARALFDRLAVFSAGFTRDAAEALGGPDARAALTDLVEASLVVPESGVGTVTRYRMLVPIRRHALARLTAAGDEPAIRDRHARYVLDLAERSEARLRGADQERWLRRLRAEAANLRDAMAWFADRPGDRYGDLRLAATLATYCRLEGRYREGLDWLAAALARRPDAPPGLRARAGIGAAMLAMLYCDYPSAIEHAEVARSACRAAGDRQGEARVELTLGSVAREEARYADSAAHLAAAAALFAECGDEWGAAQAALLRGCTCWLSGDLGRAEPVLRASLRRYERLGDLEAEASALVNLGAVALYRGDPDRAAALLDAALQRFAAIRFPEGIGWAHNLRGVVELRARRTDRAAAHLTASLAAHRQVGDRWRTASVLEALAELARLDGAADRGARLLGAAARIRAEIGAPVPGCERPEVEATESGLRAELGGDAFRRAHQQGRSAPLDSLTGAAPPAPTRPVAG
ncbi:BTAD domain-containing putative transcriptional regulator [Micromonospora zhanjiangensis]|uniref:BTAD domain-containing putative transcriptional regulator n=1 Tax=Micromonospora zhanjiangensis TaxID=1522057 RepID=A0ABV8KQ16_9ACTN